MQSTFSKIAVSSLVSAAVAAAALSPVFVLAKTSPCDATGDKTTVAGIIARGDCRISERDTDLSAALTRVSQMTKVSQTVKDQLTQTLNNTVSTMGTIKSKLDADTDLTTVKTDYRSIFNSVRVYQLILPQTWMVAASDRMEDATAKLQTLHDDLQTLVNGLQDNTTKGAAQQLLDSMASSISDANTQVGTVMNTSTGVLSLMPDNGDKTKQSANQTAIKGFRANIQTARTDINTAVSDAKQVKQMIGAN